MRELFNGPSSRTTRVSRYQKGKPIWILLKQETVSGSGISWAVYKSAPRSRQTTTPAPYHSVFTGRMPFLPPNQQRQSIEGPPTKPFIFYFSLMIDASRLRLSWRTVDQCFSYRPNFHSALCLAIVQFSIFSLYSLSSNHPQLNWAQASNQLNTALAVIRDWVFVAYRFKKFVRFYEFYQFFEIRKNS